MEDFWAHPSNIHAPRSTPSTHSMSLVRTTPAAGLLLLSTYTPCMFLAGHTHSNSSPRLTVLLPLTRALAMHGTTMALWGCTASTYKLSSSRAFLHDLLRL